MLLRASYFIFSATKLTSSGCLQWATAKYSVVIIAINIEKNAVEDWKIKKNTT
jgi:hypothetical protein